ncbi:hypothetical protein [Pelosinus baikalensis]|jgi:hypothetical protein|uniref:Uncharacterized protein n=1 Tax=Pelosinus baikalensis TaxID=2892015 RepID=A0ABS8HUZ5_9FIRM|nr:hypothetical protein [Pelosinus baikalensis]MCC5466984.1 hypothetical protein [Pelosinus baikalensis]
MAKEIKSVLQPGDKIYTLFEYNEVVIKGSKESFIIRIEKIEESKKNNCCQYVRAMG